jgi:hypothetical protein
MSDLLKSLFGSAAPAAASGGEASGAAPVAGAVKLGGSVSGSGSGKTRRSRCPRGSRRCKETGKCIHVKGYTAKKRCPRGTRRSPITGECKKIEMLLRDVSKSQRETSGLMKSSAEKVKEVAKVALGEVAELKKADAAVASAGVDRLAAARAAAALKRQKKTSASAARAAGKIAAAEAREKKAAEFEEDRKTEREAVLAKIARTRKAMGIRKNEENPASLRHLIEQWEMESNVRLYNKYHK